MLSQYIRGNRIKCILFIIKSIVAQWFLLSKADLFKAMNFHYSNLNCDYYEAGL